MKEEEKSTLDPDEPFSNRLLGLAGVAFGQKRQEERGEQYTNKHGVTPGQRCCQDNEIHQDF